MYASYASLLAHVCSNAYSFALSFTNATALAPHSFATRTRSAISSSNRFTTAPSPDGITNSFRASYPPDAVFPARARTRRRSTPVAPVAHDARARALATARIARRRALAPDARRPASIDRLVVHRWVDRSSIGASIDRPSVGPSIVDRSSIGRPSIVHRSPRSRATGAGRSGCGCDVCGRTVRDDRDLG